MDLFNCYYGHAIISKLVNANLIVLGVSSAHDELLYAMLLLLVGHLLNFFFSTRSLHYHLNICYVTAMVVLVNYYAYQHLAGRILLLILSSFSTSYHRALSSTISHYQLIQVKVKHLISFQHQEISSRHIFLALIYYVEIFVRANHFKS